MAEKNCTVRVLTLRETVRAASQALAHLDADRLEEMAAACSALRRPLPPPGSGERRLLMAESREAAQEMAVFARVLAATRENLQVMRRLRSLREGRLEYTAEAGYGHD